MFKRLYTRKNTAILITDRIFRKYFSKIDIDEGVMVLGEEIAYFLDARYFGGYEDTLKSLGICPLLYKGEQDIKDYLLGKGVKTLYIDFDKTTVTEFRKYKTFGLKLKDGGDRLNRARSIKSAKEISLIKKSCSIIEKAIYFAIDNLSVGKTELEVAKEIEDKIISLGGDGTSFDTIVAFNENSAVPHHEPSDKKLELNSVVLIDTGASYKGYASDITRTIYFGGAPSSEFIRVYNAVKTANELAIEISTSSMTAVEMDAIARDFLISQGYGEYFTHSLGHGLGLEIHEYPRLSPKGRGKISNGTVFTIEPGVYLDGKFGVRIEDTVVMKNGKIQRLYTDSKDLLVK